jgi:hypothetical protein
MQDNYHEVYLRVDDMNINEKYEIKDPLESSHSEQFGISD